MTDQPRYRPLSERQRERDQARPVPPGTESYGLFSDKPSPAAPPAKPSRSLLGHPVTLVLVLIALIYIGITRPAAGIIILAVLVLGAFIGFLLRLIRR